MSSTPFAIVNKFEEAIAEYAGSKYAVAVDSCCNALFLSCVYDKVKTVHIPRFTYPGVASAIIHAGGKVKFHDDHWEGGYCLSPNLIIDSALRFRKDMYVKDTFYCLSFHVKKHLPIGRGGMILMDNRKAYEWFKRARFDGRNEKPLVEGNISMAGWNMYITPEQAARGLTIFDIIKDKYFQDIDNTKQGYPDLSRIKAYQ